MIKVIFAFIVVQVCLAQSILNEKYDNGIIIRFNSAYSPFPDINRINGHSYQGIKYSFEEHYKDSTILLYIPEKFNKNQSFNLVFYFHGWYNNIDSSIKQFKLLDQFYESHKNAVFIIVQGPKNSPDSYGGKLESKGIFKKLVGEIANILLVKKIVNKQNVEGIILSGHSGAYRIISYILNRGGLTGKVKEVYLFDALYGQTEKYIHWLLKNKPRFISIYTKEGGTKSENENLINDLNDWGVKNIVMSEEKINDIVLKNNKIIFLDSEMGHNEVISSRKNFFRFLKTSYLKKIKE